MFCTFSNVLILTSSELGVQFPDAEFIFFGLYQSSQSDSSNAAIYPEVLRQACKDFRLRQFCQLGNSSMLGASLGLVRSSGPLSPPAQPSAHPTPDARRALRAASP